MIQRSLDISFMFRKQMTILGFASIFLQSGVHCMPPMFLKVNNNNNNNE